ncbi:hypothetical protein [Ferruginibacter albus]|uniref:hypothetical protein n=1 Tax=Ferruginibacter albus TaxID=2875540 RepID=UPI001CC50ED5|nr:hypothetical protein [Ferruginibacter albus]UAY52736.1 hypothetical protein K9M53_03350 [Ferruginibacter albus]
MTNDIKIESQSLRSHVLESIKKFLAEEKFQQDEITALGILEVINLISDYHEEGIALFPEVIITNSLDFFRTISNKRLPISEGILNVNEFKKVIKLCAPLAIDSWVIFIEISNGKINYGLVSAEITETSLSLYNQTVGDLKVNYKDSTIAYLKNIGQKTVELCGLKNKLIVSLTLNSPTEVTNEITTLSKAISQKCEETYNQQISSFFEKTIAEALRIGHGNLIAVIDESGDSIAKLIAQETNCIHLPLPIDFEQLIIGAEIGKSNEASVSLKSYSSILKAMMNHDGITVFTNKGKLIAYRLLINAYEKGGQEISGATRSKAFLSMQNSNLFLSCFFKSQDGNMKIWTHG